MDKRQPFIVCGITGWCLELIFTGILSAVRKDFSLKGTSSLWLPVSDRDRKKFGMSRFF